MLTPVALKTAISRFLAVIFILIMGINFSSAQTKPHDIPFMTVKIEQGEAALKDKRYLEAFSLFKEEADNNNPLAMSRIAVIYDQGLGTSKDSDKALEWTTKSAQNSYAPSQFVMLSNALGNKNTDDVEKWIKALNSHTDTDTLLYIGKVSQRLNPPQIELAIKTNLKAADAGNLYGQHDAAALWFKYTTSDEEKAKAFGLIMDAANKGHPASLYVIGKFQMQGYGLEKDEANGMNKIYQAANKGYGEAMGAVRNKLEKDLTETGNIVDLLMWAELAAAYAPGMNKAPYVPGHISTPALGDYLKIVEKASDAEINEANKRARAKAAEWGEAGISFLQQGGIKPYSCNLETTKCPKKRVKTFKGPAIHGTPHGKGEETYVRIYGKNKGKDNGSYKGQFKIGNKDGYGTYTYSNGKSYRGQWKNDKRSGQGIFKEPDGAYRDGLWVNGKFDSGKTKIFADNSYYEGDWVGYRKRKKVGYHGSGVQKIISGKRKGDYKDGKWRNSKFISGKMRFTYKDRSVYEGQFSNGNRHGTGTYKFANGNRYVGDWKDGNRTGNGTNYYSDGDRYVGGWKDNKRTGNGTYYFSNGSRYVGGWKDNKRTGNGTYYFSNGGYCKGYWANDKVSNGRGKYRNEKKMSDCWTGSNGDITFK